MSPDQLADRIMARIERDQAIHKSSIVEELQLACAVPVKHQPRFKYTGEQEFNRSWAELVEQITARARK